MLMTHRSNLPRFDIHPSRLLTRYSIYRPHCRGLRQAALGSLREKLKAGIHSKSPRETARLEVDSRFEWRTKSQLREMTPAIAPSRRNRRQERSPKAPLFSFVPPIAFFSTTFSR